MQLAGWLASWIADLQLPTETENTEKQFNLIFAHISCSSKFAFFFFLAAVQMLRATLSVSQSAAVLPIYDARPLPSVLASFLANSGQYGLVISVHVKFYCLRFENRHTERMDRNRKTKANSNL